MSDEDLRRSVPVREWRMRDAEPYGMWMWFDPHRESVELYDVPSLVRILMADKAKPLAGVDTSQFSLYLDREVSVRALPEPETPALSNEFVDPGDQDLPF